MNQTFVELLEDNADHAAAFDGKFDDVQDAQQPAAVTVCCSDSRVLQDHIWNTDQPGSVFTCSNIGNRVLQRTDSGTAVSGDVLYPIEHTGTETAIVIGHTGCGAVTATYDALRDGISEPAGIEHCLALLKPHLAPGVQVLPEDIGRAEAINRLVEFNVDRQVEALLESPDIPQSVSVAGVVYDFQDVYGGKRGEVHVINIDGQRRCDVLQADYPDIASRVNRLWEY